MRRIGVVTVGRSDFGLYLPLLRLIRSDPGLELLLFVTGAHLEPAHGRTVRFIREAGFAKYVGVRMLDSADDAAGVARSIGRGVGGFAAAYRRHRPDILVILGDRFEMHAAALAAVPFNIPLAHIHGGEATEGAIDDVLRHSMTKLSHLHFPSTGTYARRIRQMGEESWRVTEVGAIGLDNIRSLKVPSRRGLAESIGRLVLDPFLLVTYHPVTLEPASTRSHAANLVRALHRSGLPVLATAPNADAEGRKIAGLLKRFVLKHPGSVYVENLGTERYLAAMGAAAAMVGNSSSGIIEAASHRLPVVNVGSRQAGRLRPRNVIQSGDGEREILAAIRKALSDRFRRSLRNLRNPYDAGGAGRKILGILRTTPLGPKLLRKQFQDLNPRSRRGA